MGQPNVWIYNLSWRIKLSALSSEQTTLREAPQEKETWRSQFTNIAIPPSSGSWQIETDNQNICTIEQDVSKFSKTDFLIRFLLYLQSCTFYNVTLYYYDCMLQNSNILQFFQCHFRRYFRYCCDVIVYLLIIAIESYIACVYICTFASCFFLLNDGCHVIHQCWMTRNLKNVQSSRWQLKKLSASDYRKTRTVSSRAF